MTVTTPLVGITRMDELHELLHHLGTQAGPPATVFGAQNPTRPSRTLSEEIADSIAAEHAAPHAAGIELLDGLERAANLQRLRG